MCLRLASGSRQILTAVKVRLSFTRYFHSYFLHEHQIDDSSASHLLQSKSHANWQEDGLQGARQPVFGQAESKWEAKYVRKSKDDSTGSSSDAGVQRLSAG